MQCHKDRGCNFYLTESSTGAGEGGLGVAEEVSLAPQSAYHS